MKKVLDPTPLKRSDMLTEDHEQTDVEETKMPVENDEDIEMTLKEKLSELAEGSKVSLTKYEAEELAMELNECLLKESNDKDIIDIIYRHEDKSFMKEVVKLMKPTVAFRFIEIMCKSILQNVRTLTCKKWLNSVYLEFVVHLAGLPEDSSLMTSPHYRKMVNRPSTSESLRRIMYKLEGKLDCMMKETLRLNTEDENNIDAEYYFNDDEEDTDNEEFEGIEESEDDDEGLEDDVEEHVEDDMEE